MDSREAREILLLYRPDTADAGDPQFSEALKATERDAELGRWFAAHCERQAQIRRELKRIAVPGRLKQDILDAVARGRVIVWWRRPVFQAWAAAAAVLLLASLAYFRPSQTEESFAAYRDEVVRGVQRGYYTMDMVTNDVAQIRQYLAKHQWHADFTLTPSLEKLNGIGCATNQWHGRKVSLICLDSGQSGSPQDVLYLFVVDRSQFADPPAADQFHYVPIRRLTSASWSHGDKAYVLAVPGGEERLRKFL
jgi:hypothetical protein